jgi:broad specificity phosphatase PhoE
MTAERPPQIELYLLRHAQSRSNLDRNIIAGRDTLTQLSQLGELEAEGLGEWFLAEGIFPDKVCASPAVRTRQTAEICLRTMGCEVVPVVDDRLPEMSQGVWEGRRRSQVYRPAVVAQIVRQRRDFRAPGGESINMTHERMQAFIDDVARDATTETEERERPEIVFAFTHGLSTRVLVGTMLGWSMNEIRRREIANASPTLLTFDGTDWAPQYIGRPIVTVPPVAA